MKKNVRGNGQCGRGGVGCRFSQHGMEDTLCVMQAVDFTSFHFLLPIVHYVCVGGWLLREGDEAEA